MQKTYELLFIIPAKFTEDELQPIKDLVVDLIKNNGGEIVKEDTLGKRKLAYPIKHIFHGYYILYHFQIDTEVIQKINQTLRHTPEILRHIIVHPTPVQEKRIRRPLTDQSEEVQEEKDQEEIVADTSSEEKTEKKKLATKKSKETDTTKEEESTDKKRKKITLEELDKSLDEILKDDMI